MIKQLSLSYLKEYVGRDVLHFFHLFEHAL